MSKRNCAHCGRTVYGEGYATMDGHPFCSKRCLELYSEEKRREVKKRITKRAVVVGILVGLLVEYFNPGDGLAVGIIAGIATRVVMLLFSRL